MRHMIHVLLLALHVMRIRITIPPSGLACVSAKFLQSRLDMALEGNRTMEEVRSHTY